jgi:sugar lactone lactonase YvrE
MKMKKPDLKRLGLVASTLVCCALNLPAQTPPAITAQPASQTNLPGANITFIVGVSGTGPFSYQWQFNGSSSLYPTNIIATVAGEGDDGFSGDGGAATSAELFYPQAVAFDGLGNMYIADYVNTCVRKVDPHGIITTVAGNGDYDYSGDGGAATNASLYYPSGVALDGAGNLFIADQGNNCIREVETNGIIITVAGNGQSAYSGDGGAATNASLADPGGVAVDSSGNIYIADTGNQCVRKVNANGIISTVAGNGIAQFAGDGGAATNASLSGPSGVALDAFGNLYIADCFNQRIRRVGANGAITTVAGNGASKFAGDGSAATNASLDYPNGVALDAFGNLYIADTANSRIRRVTGNGIITTAAGNGVAKFAGDGSAATNASLYYPAGVALALNGAGNLYIADTYNSRIREVISSPTLVISNVTATNAGAYTVVVTSPYGSATSAVATLTVEAPPAITLQPISQIVLGGSSPVFSVAVVGTGPFGYLWLFAGTNLVQNGANRTLTVSGVSTNEAGSYTVVVTNAWGSVTSRVATLKVVFPPSTTSQTTNLAVLAGGNVTLNVTVEGTGPFTYQWQCNGANLPNNIIGTVAGNGEQYNSYGSFSGDGGPAINAGLDLPAAVGLDASGNLYIADTYNQRIREVGANGVITTVAGGGCPPGFPPELMPGEPFAMIGGSFGDGGLATNAGLEYAGGIFLSAFGNLYIADTRNNRIRFVGTNGIISTVAGDGAVTNLGSEIFSGDGRPATNAELDSPQAVCLDAFGNLYIADTYNERIRKVGTNGVITTVAGDGYSTGFPGWGYHVGSFSGDGGPATSAELNTPSGVVTDPHGNLYIADTYNERIRKVGPNGIITTVAGNGYSPDSPPDSPVGSFSGDGGPATNAGLNQPVSVALDASGGLYIADSYNRRIRFVGTNGIISTVAGGNETYAYAGDGGAATNASLYVPCGVALDSSGNLYIADTGNQRIREVYLAGLPTLALANVSTNNAGNYTVVITGPYGSVTSAVAALTVALSAPQIVTGDGCFGFMTNQFGFNISGAFGQTIVVDGSVDLVHWTPLCTNTAGSSPVYFCDPCWTNFPGRFYRARLP